MKTKTQMVFFQPKKQISIRRNQVKLKKLNDITSNFNFKPTLKFLDSYDLKAHSLEKRKLTKIKNISSKSEVSSNFNYSQERKITNKNVNKNNNFMFSNVHFFKRKINNKLILDSNHNSAIEESKKNDYYRIIYHQIIKLLICASVHLVFIFSSNLVNFLKKYNY
jgi:hypothetical protein